MANQEDLKSGTVKFFDDRKGFGFVALANGEDAFVGRGALPGSGYRTLFPNEPVRVRVEHGAKGLQVTQLETPAERGRGVVRDFDFQRGFGVIVDSTGSTLFAHYSNVLTRGGRAELHGGEDVEYFARLRPGRGEAEAYLIKRLDSRQPFERFSYVADQQWQVLAALAEEEDWNYDTPDPDATESAAQAETSELSQRLPILEKYIRYTFSRVQEQGKVVEGHRDEVKFSAFNTGLVTPNQEVIYGLFEAQEAQSDGHGWRFVAWVKASDPRVSGLFLARPSMATYWTDARVLFFEPGREVVIDFDHLIQDNIERYPPALAQNRELARLATVAAVDSAKKRVARNYKTAVPQFHRGEIQLLLPLSLDGTGRAQLALVVRAAGHEYIGETVLGLHEAMSNARLVARPDRDWLKP